MIFLFRLVLSALTGSMFAASNLAPAGEIRRFFNNRKRIVRSLIVSFLALFCLLADVVAVVLDVVIQFEHQGFVAWNGLLTGLAILAALSFAAIWVAVATLPTADDFAVKPTAEELMEVVIKILRPLITAFHLEKVVGNLLAAHLPPKETSTQDTGAVTRPGDI